MAERIALVTGAGRGIGRATASVLAQCGLHVVGVSRTEDELKALARECGADYIVGSVQTQAGCERIARLTTERFGRIDVLVNNAGIDPVQGVVWKMDPSVWFSVFDVNIHGPFHLTRLAAAQMVEKKWGRIVNVASTAAQNYGINSEASAYAATKHALLGFTRVVALEVAPHNVTCNAVLPGWVRTPMAEESAARDAERDGISVEEVWERYTSLYSAGRTVTPEEVAKVIAFLASDDASGVNGEGVVVALEGRG
jgi:3-hydroxybutyrate dehydrogenase